MAARGKKLRGNGLWESSRMMLPQHKEAIRRHRVKLAERSKPELDEQRLEELSLTLGAASESGEAISVTTFGPYEDEVQIGIVEKIDPVQRYIKLRTEEGQVWIPFADIVHAAPAAAN